ncbi:hypothetical protein CCAX7_009670 [Capsulimonas corticalis]|uniref:Protein OrfX2/OrfX3/P47 domain-containing protein n=1 Tax=Capsulimonas corticalis TaxID=2219043 RepID=A0A402CUA4_9BACT|nr:TULIP family P47-like protein [Capsulimonas corticalis]BDI28916.1 hypothetical protein CCAX7_009670 [Capsulimonas corticalis]
MNTYGWDTVFIVNEDRINTIMAAHKDTVTQCFEMAVPGTPTQKASGLFGAWQVAQGGSHEIIHLRLPIDQGVLSSPDGPINLAGLTLVIAVQLRWLEVQGNQNQQALKFDYRRLAEPNNPPTQDELSVIELRDPDSVLTPAQNALLSYALGKYLVANADQARFTFATVNLVPPTINSWLAPKKSAYAYLQKESSDTGYLVIFSVTTDRDISNLERRVDEKAFPTATNASFLISDKLFLLNSVAPALAKAFNTNSEAFVFMEGERTLRNKHALWARTVRVGLIDYTPSISTLIVRSGENNLDGIYSGSVDMRAGIMLYYNIHAKNPGYYDSGNGMLAFQPDPHPVESHNADIPWWFYLTGIIVIAIVEIVVKVISDDLARQITDDNRERLALGKNPPSSISWGYDSGWSVSFVGINGAVYLHGNV